MIGYPPSHRNVKEPQPEVCELCGLRVGGGRLRQSQVEGLRGLWICDTERCVEFRSALSFQDRRLHSSREHQIIGQSRVFPPGAAKALDTE